MVDTPEKYIAHVSLTKSELSLLLDYFETVIGDAPVLNRDEQAIYDKLREAMAGISREILEHSSGRRT